MDATEVVFPSLNSVDPFIYEWCVRIGKFMPVKLHSYFWIVWIYLYA